jgi:hypothetical protein
MSFMGAIIVVLTFLALWCIGCSMTQLTVNQTAKVFAKASPTFDKESDLELADLGIMANLKTLEGLLEVHPDNEELLLINARSFALYAFAFVEEKLEKAAAEGDLQTQAEIKARAIDFYERGRGYGLRLLLKAQKEFPKVINGDTERLQSALKKLKKKHVPGLFWTAYAWGGAINLQQDNPAQLVNLSKVELMMRRVIELDESFFFGGAHLFYAAYYGSLPPLLGGNPEKVKEHLQRVDQISGGKFLLSKLFLARYYAYPLQDRSLYKSLLQQILEAPIDIFPEQRLANAVAKARAKRWISQMDELFGEE